MPFKATKDQASINMYAPQKQFITKLFEVPNGDTHLMLMANSKEDATDAAQPAKSRIISIDSFPSATYQTVSFLRR
jgi:hypothetical protein